VSAIADRLRDVKPPKLGGCGVCNAYAGLLDGWDDDDLAALREQVNSKAGYKALGDALKGTGVSADSIRLHRSLKHGDG
jgi:hypothetical protein